MSVPARAAVAESVSVVPEAPPTGGEVLFVAPRRRRHLERTRADILEATFRVVADSGYVGSRIEEICSRASISRGAFYHHFPSKEAAIVALIERNVQPLADESRRIEAAHRRDPVRMISLLMAAIMRWVASGGPITRAYFVEMGGVPEADELRDRLEGDFIAFLDRTIGPLFASGELTSTAVPTTFRALAGMMKEAAAGAARDPRADLAGAIREVVRMALQGIGVDHARATALADGAALYRPVW